MKSCSGVGQGLFHLGGAGHVERCHPASVRRVGIGPVPNKKPDDLELPAVDGPAQRRLLLGVARVIPEQLRLAPVGRRTRLVQGRPLVRVVGFDGRPDQQWLDRIREHLVQNLSIDREDFDTIPVLHRLGRWSAADRARHKAIRQKLASCPTQQNLQASGVYEGPIKSGAYFLVRVLMHELKKSRQEAGLTLAAVSKRTGIDQAKIVGLAEVKVPVDVIGQVIVQLPRVTGGELAATGQPRWVLPAGVAMMASVASFGKKPVSTTPAHWRRWATRSAMSSAGGTRTSRMR